MLNAGIPTSIYVIINLHMTPIDRLTTGIAGFPIPCKTLENVRSIDKHTIPNDKTCSVGTARAESSGCPG